MAAEDSDGEKLTLSASTLSALQDFYHEKEARQRQFEELKSHAEEDFDESKEWSIDAFTEDWNASQFWYTDETASAIAQALLKGSTADSGIAVVSAPSVFIQLKKLLSTTPPTHRPTLRLLEYDTRFAVFGTEFIPYDFAQPLRVPAELKGRFDRIVCDPPFLSEDCQTKAALTVRWLARSWQQGGGGESPNADGLLQQHPQQEQQRITVCTGERMEALVLRLYGKAGVRTTEFLPRHSKGLSNEFRCYANCEVGGEG